jgi:dienelactone hydrolase
VLGIFGKQDHLFDFSEVEKFSEKLLASSADHKIAVYDDVGHGFLNPLSPKHGKESAEKAWKETISHFDNYLK